MRAMTPPHKVSHIKQTEWAGTKALLAERALSDLKLGLENEHYSSADIPPRHGLPKTSVLLLNVIIYKYNVLFQHLHNFEQWW